MGNMDFLTRMSWKAEVTRYALVGGGAFIGDYSAFLLCVDFLGLGYMLASFFGFLVGVSLNYFFCSGWVFKRSHKMGGVEFFWFVLSGVWGVILTFLLMYWIVEKEGLNEKISRAVVAIVVFVVNYLIRKNFVFLNAKVESNVA